MDLEDDFNKKIENQSMSADPEKEAFLGDGKRQSPPILTHTDPGEPRDSSSVDVGRWSISSSAAAMVWDGAVGGRWVVLVCVSEKKNVVPSESAKKSKKI